MKIEIEISEENEGTSYPWWVILDPRQLFHTSGDGIFELAGMITGPYFSRDEAALELKNRRYAYGKNAVVFCLSGCHSGQYQQQIRRSQAMAAYM